MPIKDEQHVMWILGDCVLCDNDLCEGTCKSVDLCVTALPSVELCVTATGRAIRGNIRFQRTK